MSHCCVGTVLGLKGPVLTRLLGHEETLFTCLFSALFPSLGDSCRRIFVFTLQEFEFHILGWSDAALKSFLFPSWRVKQLLSCVRSILHNCR